MCGSISTERTLSGRTLLSEFYSELCTRSGQRARKRERVRERAPLINLRPRVPAPDVWPLIKTLPPRVGRRGMDFCSFGRRKFPCRTLDQRWRATPQKQRFPVARGEEISILRHEGGKWAIFVEREVPGSAKRWLKSHGVAIALLPM